jgi:hypothetical protein
VLACVLDVVPSLTQRVFCVIDRVVDAVSDVAETIPERAETFTHGFEFVLRAHSVGLLSACQEIRGGRHRAAPLDQYSVHPGPSDPAVARHRSLAAWAAAAG